MKFWLLILFTQSGNIAIPMQELSCKMAVQISQAKPGMNAVCIPPTRKVGVSA